MSSFWVVDLTFSFLPRFARSLARAYLSSRIPLSAFISFTLVSYFACYSSLGHLDCYTRSRSSLAFASFLGCLHHFRRRVSISRILPLCYVRFLLCLAILCLTFNSFRIAVTFIFRILSIPRGRTYHSHFFSFVLSYLSIAILVFRPPPSALSYPPLSQSFALSRATSPPFSLYLLLSSIPSASCAHTRTARVSVSLALSPTVPCPYDEECRQRSNRSLAFARATPLLYPSAVREPTPLSAPALLPSLPSPSPPSLQPSPPPSLLFPQISSTIFAISITRAHLFLL